MGIQNKIPPRWSSSVIHGAIGVKGYNQLLGIDFDDTSSPAVKSPTIRIILTISTVMQWTIKQLDVKMHFNMVICNKGW